MRTILVIASSVLLSSCAATGPVDISQAAKNFCANKAIVEAAIATNHPNDPLLVQRLINAVELQCAFLPSMAPIK